MKCNTRTGRPYPLRELALTLHSLYMAGHITLGDFHSFLTHMGLPIMSPEELPARILTKRTFLEQLADDPVGRAQFIEKLQQLGKETT